MPDAFQPLAPTMETSIPRRRLKGKPTEISAPLIWPRRRMLATSEWLPNKHPNRCAITRTEKEEMLQYSRKDDEQRDAAALVH
ncbi:hypothetical protein GQ457_16G022070 [Hibiscus cannabinus]